MEMRSSRIALSLFLTLIGAVAIALGTADGCPTLAADGAETPWYETDTMAEGDHFDRGSTWEEQETATDETPQAEAVAESDPVGECDYRYEYPEQDYGYCG